MNLPNKLSLGRLISVPIVMIVLGLPDSVVPLRVSGLIGGILFILAALTDMLDGKIARSRGLVTDFGKLIDPLADKFMVLGALIMLLYRAESPFWHVGLTVTLAVVLFRELAVTSMRLLAAGKSGVVVAAKMVGKVKTVVQIVFVSAMLLEPLLYDALAGADGALAIAEVMPISVAAMVGTVVMTVWSGLDYIISLWKYVETK